MSFDLKDLYNLRKYIFTIRFFPLFISFLLSMAVFSFYGFLNKYFFYSIIFILSSLLFSIIWVRFGLKLQFAQNLHKEFKFREEYLLYNKLQIETLLESEKFELRLYQSQLFFRVGNYKRFLQNIDELSEEIIKYPKNEIFYRLLKSFYYEIKNDFINSKNELIFITEKSNKDNLKIQAYNNIARLEEIENKSSKEAQIFYEKAFNILKGKALPHFYPITIHNLIICYSKNKNIEKAKKILEDYYNLIDKKSSKQLLEYTNDLTHLARQIHDKKLLEESYLIANEQLPYLLKEEEKLVLEITQLRMRCNDDIDFEKYFLATFDKIKSNKDRFLLIEKLNITTELNHVIKQKIENSSQIQKWSDYLFWCIDWEISLEEDIQNKLKEIEHPLCSEKIFWLNQLVRIKKALLIKNGNLYQSFNINDFNEMTNIIEEIIEIWAKAENEPEYIYAIIHLTDEIYSFYDQTKIIQIFTDYNEKIINYLKIADNLLEKYHTNPNYAHCLISLSFFSLVIKKDKILAKKWIERFDDLNISLNHYAIYLRNWYSFC
jgi:hypothetical protein